MLNGLLKKFGFPFFHLCRRAEGAPRTSPRLHAEVPAFPGAPTLRKASGGGASRRHALRHAGVVSQTPTHLRQGFGGSSAGERNPPKHSRLIAAMKSCALTHSSTSKAGSPA